MSNQANINTVNKQKDDNKTGKNCDLNKINSNNCNKKQSGEKTKLKKPKFIIGNGNVEGISGAIRNFHYYVGFWNKNTSEEKVIEHINKFAIVNKIEELNTEGKYYKSFHVEVNDCYNDKMIDPSNWPTNVKIKRFIVNKKKSNNDNEIRKEDNKSNVNNNSNVNNVDNLKNVNNVNNENEINDVSEPNAAEEVMDS
jgi:hypothetical protein